MVFSNNCLNTVVYLMSNEILELVISYHGRISLPFTISIFSRRAKLVYRNSNQACKVGMHYLDCSNWIMINRVSNRIQGVSHLINLNSQCWKASVPYPPSQEEEGRWKQQKQIGSPILPTQKVKLMTLC
jgi:hypothetical protein